MNTPAETGDAAGSQETAEGAAPPGAGGRPGPAAPARPRRAALDLGLRAPRTSVCCVSCTVRGASLRRPCLAWAGGPPPSGRPPPPRSRGALASGPTAWGCQRLSRPFLEQRVPSAPPVSLCCQPTPRRLCRRQRWPPLEAGTARDKMWPCTLARSLPQALPGDFGDQPAILQPLRLHILSLV